MGGFEKRSSWNPSHTMKPTTSARRSANDDQAGRERQPAAWGGDRPRHGDDRLRLARVASLSAPLEQYLIGVEAEIERVVAQEALRVDRAGQLAVIAPLEGGQVACPDLGVALGAVQVHALPLASGEEAFGQAGCDVTGRHARLAFRTGRRSPDLIPRRH